MTTFVAFLRGINVGGKNKLPMAELKKLLESLSLQKIQTYIQSGNIVFDTRRKDKLKLESAITQRIESQFGFAPQTFLLQTSELRSAAQKNPFPQAEENPKGLHCFFLHGTANKTWLQLAEKLKQDSEAFELKENVFYIWAPDGIARSKLVARIDKGLLGTTVTARNWRTVSKMLELLDSRAS